MENGTCPTDEDRETADIYLKAVFFDRPRHREISRRLSVSLAQGLRFGEAAE